MVAWSDGGGKVTAARRPVAGRDRVIRYVARFGVGVEFAHAEVNGQDALLARRGDELVTVLVVEVADDRVIGLRAMLNPDKLSRFR
ncbi:hypothetical protein [Streptosporangium canum]|uniref:hypothetical protein n=1 Tax=Streptosporangium canum TaxID=324952 RepID=UPI0037A67D1E